MWVLVSLLNFNGLSGSDSSLYYYQGGYRKCTGGLWRFQNPEDRCDRLVPPDPDGVDWSMKAVRENKRRLESELLDRKFKRLLRKVEEEN
jgi:hypothetical protein